jgi:hypothetical protein
LGEQFTVLGDPTTILLRRFEDAKTPTLKDLQSPSSPTSTKAEIEDEHVAIMPDTDTSLMIETAEGLPGGMVECMADEFVVESGDPVLWTEQLLEEWKRIFTEQGLGNSECPSWNNHSP